MNAEIICGDALIELKKLPSASFDAVICDPPYATTNCFWDQPLDWSALWPELWRVCSSERSPVILFAQQPFTTDLINSQRANFRYDLVWDKQVSGHPFTANVRPLPVHETMLLFGRAAGVYNPQKILGRPNNGRKSNERKGNSIFQAKLRDTASDRSGWKFPTSIVRSPKHTSREKDHPTQKPVDLMDWLVRTYTDEGHRILDFTCGSGSTLVAAARINRPCIGIDSNENFCRIARERCEAALGSFTAREFGGLFGAL